MQKERVTNEVLIEKLVSWAAKFISNQQPMSYALSEAFIKIMLMETKNAAVPDQIKSSFMYQVLELRFKTIGVEPTPHVIAFLSFLVKSPGEAVMFMYALRVRNGKGLLNMNLIAYIFMTGFPSEEHLSHMWDEQKVGGANMLDMVDVRCLP